MATYIVLTNWTDEGARAAKDTVARAEKVRGVVESLGGKLTHLFWTMGRYDLVAITEAPDDETATAIALAVSGSGMVRSETLRAFSAEEMTNILGRVAG